MSTKTIRKLKIFAGGGRLHGHTGQKNFFVAATSRSKAVEALHAHGVFESLGRVTSHWHTIDYKEGMPNDVHYARAIAEPGQVFSSPFGFQSDKKYDPLPKLDLNAKNEEKRAALVQKRTASPSL
jgi:hypothetical protein